MTLKTISDKPKSLTFTYECKSYDHAQVASKGIMGYMLGTYYQPVITTTYGAKARNGGCLLKVEYAEDKALDDVFERICKGLEGSADGVMIEITE